MLNQFARCICCMVVLLASLHVQAQQTIQLYVTVDWEGLSLEPENIEAMQAFRKRFPHIPMLQLLNPAYFVKTDVKPSNVKATIQSVLLPTDTVGLHLHGWKSLTQHCQVPYQHQPSYANVDEHCEQADCGHTVSLEFAYSVAELSQLVRCTQRMLVEHGFQKPTHFRAGGWQLGPKLTQALVENQFTWDSSRTPAALLTSRWAPDSHLVKTVEALHPNASTLDQPYALTGMLKEFPNNAGLADYTSTQQMLDMFKTLLEEHKSVMVLGFHQETAADFLNRLEQATPQMEGLAKAQGVKIEWVSR